MAVAFAGGCRVFGLREGEPSTRRGGLAVWRHVGRERGAAAISLSALELEPGSSAAWRNGACDEVLAILEGEGFVTLAGARHPVKPGTGVYVRPHDLVEIVSSSERPLAIASSRCPDPGPEIDFADGKAAAAAESA